MLMKLSENPLKVRSECFPENVIGLTRCTRSKSLNIFFIWYIEKSLRDSCGYIYHLIKKCNYTFNLGIL